MELSLRMILRMKGSFTWNKLNGYIIKRLDGFVTIHPFNYLTIKLKYGNPDKLPNLQSQ